jgi:putative sterol carrier protein
MPDARTDFTTNIPAKISANPEKAQAIGATFLFKISGDDGGTWSVNLKDNVGVTDGDAGGADCTLELTDADWKTMSENPGAAMQLYFQGKLKVSGNAMLATKLQQILGA